MAQTSAAPALQFPGAVLDHDMPWTDWLEDGETITGFSVTSSSLELVISRVVHSGGVIFWRVSGGQPRKVYTVTVAIETSDGNADKCALTYRMRS